MSLEQPTAIGPTILPALLTDAQAAAYTSMSRASVWKLAATGEFPEPVKLPGRVTRWRRADVDAWIESLTTGK